jgi:parallel beta-helix repeat protein
MRIFLTILLLISLKANATNYYISNAGSDAANGLTTGTSWQTIAKVNASLFSPGDQILFKSGDTWIEKFIIPSSGSIGNPIIISSYGTGLKPLITGFQTLTGLVDSSHVWSTIATNSANNLNIAQIDGRIRGKGRYPNTGYLAAYGFQYPTTTWVKLLGGTPPNYVGGELVIRDVPWITDVRKIISQNVDTIFLQKALTYYPSLLNSYFLQNMVKFLDVQYEWAYDSTSKKFSYYSTTTPTDVKISTIDTLVRLVNKNYITFDNIKFTGSNMSTLQLDTANHITIQNCSFDAIGKNAITAIGSNTVIINDSFTNIQNNGIFIQRNSDTVTITNCYMKNVGMIEGNVDTDAIPISITSTRTLITKNRVDSAGYLALRFAGQNSKASNNYISNFCLLRTDGGGIYTYDNFNNPNVITDTVNNNIIINGAGQNYTAAGIYMDDNSSGFLIDNNTISNCHIYGIFLHNASNITVTNNTISNGIGNPLGILGGTPSYNVKSNIFYSPMAGNFLLNSLSSAGTSIDSNYYLASATDSIIHNGPKYTLADWKIATTNESHGVVGLPANTTTQGVLYYNTTVADLIIPLNGVYVDTKKNIYNYSITLPPYTSAILFTLTLPISGRIKNLIFK